MNVTLIGVGAGYSYVVSGPTHQCYEDLTLMRCLPNFKVLSPADHVTAAEMFDTCLNTEGPKYLRLDAQVLPVVYSSTPPDISVGFHVHRTGEMLCFIATGYMLHTALDIADQFAARGVFVGVIDLFDLATFDANCLAAEMKPYSALASLEEGFRGRGGMDAMLFDFIASRSLPLRMLNIGVEGGYSFELGTRTELHEAVGIGPNAVKQAVQSFITSLQGANTPSSPLVENL